MNDARTHRRTDAPAHRPRAVVVRRCVGPPVRLAALLAFLAAPLLAQRPDPIGAQRRSVIGTAAARIAPAVVNVNVVRRERAAPRNIFEQMYGVRGWQQVEGLGTGFLISADGLIITNQHVTSGADTIVVTLRDGREFPARLLGEDDRTDIAVVKIDATGLPTAPIGRSRALQIGDWLIAIGNPYGFVLGNTEPSVTAGVVSALGRDILPGSDQASIYVDMIQTDAAINPGNSGGPLTNADGEVVGVNTFILSQSGGSIGLGFAIPIERAMRVARAIADSGHVRRGWLGIDVAGPTDQTSSWRHQRGLTVLRVAPGSPGDQAHIRAGQVIDAINGEAVHNFLGWERLLLDLSPGDQVRLTVRSNDLQGQWTLTATDLPSASAGRVNVRDLELITVTPAIAAERRLATGRGALVVTAGQAWQRTIGLQAGDVIIQINNYVIGQAEQVGQVIDYLRSKSSPMRFFVARGDQVLSADMVGTP
jgi:serine protease Do